MKGALNTLLTLILACSVECILHFSNHSHLSSVFGWGNEPQQAEWLFGLTAKLNATDYFTDYTVCTTTSNRLFHCLKYVNKYFREYARIWGPPPSDPLEPVYPRKSKDCTYTLNHEGSHSNQISAAYKFTIKQSDCALGADIQGGAVFEAFGIDGDVLGSCSVDDLFDNTYNVQCRFLKMDSGKRHGKKDSKSDGCMLLTVVLMYEHYDGLSEVLLDWSHLYPPLRYVLADNLQFCLDSGRGTGAASVSASKDSPKLSTAWPGVPESVTWHTGVWVNKRTSSKSSKGSKISDNSDATVYYQQAFSTPGLLVTNATAWTNFQYEHIPSSATSAYLHKVFANTTAKFPKQDNPAHVTIPRTNSQLPHYLADRYTFEAMVFTGTEEGIRRHLDRPHASNAERVRACRNRGFASALCEESHSAEHTRPADPSTVPADHHQCLTAPATVAASYQEAHYLRNFTSDLFHRFMTNYIPATNTTAARLSMVPVSGPPREELVGKPNMLYHFVGASHMRYNFDAVTEYFLGPQVLEDVPRKHDDLQIVNMRYNFIANARHQSAFLTDLCERLQNDTRSGNYSISSSNHTLIFQTGAWDLSSGSLRRLIKDPNVGLRLLKVFEGMITGALPCGHLKHIVWMTSLPHPVCYDDANTGCAANRSYRLNAAISAGNDFYLRYLLKIIQDAAAAGSSAIRVSVIDTYNIVRPRLIFNEDNEVNCLNHYSCRVSAPASSRYAEGRANVMLHTPGGAAVVKSIINALALDSYF
jgi:hypothetical protein